MSRSMINEYNNESESDNSSSNSDTSMRKKGPGRPRKSPSEKKRNKAIYNLKYEKEKYESDFKYRIKKCKKSKKYYDTQKSTNIVL